MAGIRARPGEMLACGSGGESPILRTKDHSRWPTKSEATQATRPGDSLIEPVALVTPTAIVGHRIQREILVCAPGLYKCWRADESSNIQELTNRLFGCFVLLSNNAGSKGLMVWVAAEADALVNTSCYISTWHTASHLPYSARLAFLSCFFSDVSPIPKTPRC